MTLVNTTTGIVHIGGEKYLDKYDFDMDGRPLRDFATWYGRPGGKNDGKSFYIYGYKQAKIPVKKKNNENIHIYIYRYIIVIDNNLPHSVSH